MQNDRHLFDFDSMRVEKMLEKNIWEKNQERSDFSSVTYFKFLKNLNPSSKSHLS